jgi:transcription antitermination factor NusG
MEKNNENWYVLYTKEGWEKDVYHTVIKKKIAAFLPLTGEVAATRSTNAQPLFKSYVFVKTGREQIDKVKSIAGVINLLHWLDMPLTIAESEIQKLREFVNRFKAKKVERVAVNINSASAIIACSSKGTDRDDALDNFVKLTLPFLGCYILAEGVPGNVRTIMQEKAKRRFKKQKAEETISLLTTE